MRGMRSPGWATALPSWRSELSGGFDGRAKAPAVLPGAAGPGPPGPGPQVGPEGASLCLGPARPPRSCLFRQQPSDVEIRFQADGGHWGPSSFSVYKRELMFYEKEPQCFVS